MTEMDILFVPFPPLNFSLGTVDGERDFFTLLCV